MTTDSATASLPWEPSCIIEDMPPEVRAEIFAQDFLADCQGIPVST